MSRNKQLLDVRFAPKRTDNRFRATRRDRPIAAIIPEFVGCGGRIARREQHVHYCRLAERARGYLLCAMALVVSCYVPAAALGPDDPASVYYEKCAASWEQASLMSAAMVLSLMG